MRHFIDLYVFGTNSYFFDRRKIYERGHFGSNSRCLVVADSKPAPFLVVGFLLPKLSYEGPGAAGQYNLYLVLSASMLRKKNLGRRFWHS